MVSARKKSKKGHSIVKKEEKTFTSSHTSNLDPSYSHSKSSLSNSSSRKKDSPLPSTNDNSEKKEISVNSISKVIVQVVSSSNPKLFNMILDCKDVEIRENSCSQLPHSIALQFVSFLYDAILKDPKHLDDVIPWIKTTLLHHAQYFSNLPDGKKVLLPIMDSLQDFADSYQEMQKLSGKIEFYLQIKKNKELERKNKMLLKNKNDSSSLNFITLDDETVEELTRKPIIIITEDDCGQVKMITDVGHDDEYDQSGNHYHEDNFEDDNENDHNDPNLQNDDDQNEESPSENEDQMILSEDEDYMNDQNDNNEEEYENEDQ